MRALGLQQKYIEDDSVIIVTIECLIKLESYPEEVINAILFSIDSMTRVVINDTILGLVIHNKNNDALFFSVHFVVLSTFETSVYDFSPITSDQYLDLVLDKKVLK